MSNFVTFPAQNTLPAAVWWLHCSRANGVTCFIGLRETARRRRRGGQANQHAKFQRENKELSPCRPGGLEAAAAVLRLRRLRRLHGDLARRSVPRIREDFPRTRRWFAYAPRRGQPKTEINKNKIPIPSGSLLSSSLRANVAYFHTHDPRACGVNYIRNCANFLLRSEL